MKPITLLLSALLLFAYSSFCQNLSQYFDGADTLASSSLFINIDSSSNNVWQIGRPQKTIFDDAATAPNALMTDTVNTYPINDTSTFWFNFKPTWAFGIFALQWKQKLDLDKKHDGAIIEFSVDGGTNWQNVFNNPLVYNFYGFDLANKDTLVSGEYAFSGTDTLWRDIWLCFDNSFFSLYDSAIVRYTLLTDSVDSAKEGWMIDNMMARLTIAHTATNIEPQKEYMKVYPTITNGMVNIDAQKLNQFHIIENMQLINSAGRVVEQFGKCPVKYFINISNHPDGIYFLKIKTNLKTSISRIVLRK